jgi:hypothetical protein
MPTRKQAAPAYDPTLPPKAAADYLGRSTRTLRRLHLARTPLPGTGTKRPGYGYKLSTLNAYRDSLEDPKSRAPKVRSA